MNSFYSPATSTDRRNYAVASPASLDGSVNSGRSSLTQTSKPAAAYLSDFADTAEVARDRFPGDFNKLIDDADKLTFTGPTVKVLYSIKTILSHNPQFISAFKHLPGRVVLWLNQLLCVGALIEATATTAAAAITTTTTTTVLSPGDFIAIEDRLVAAKKLLTMIDNKLRYYEVQCFTTAQLMAFRIQNDMHDRILSVDGTTAALKSFFSIEKQRECADSLRAVLTIKERSIGLLSFTTTTAAATTTATTTAATTAIPTVKAFTAAASTAADLFLQNRVEVNFSSQLGEGPHSFVYAAHMLDSDNNNSGSNSSNKNKNNNSASSVGSIKAVVVKIPKSFLDISIQSNSASSSSCSLSQQLDEAWQQQVVAMNSLVTQAQSPHLVQFLGLKSVSISAVRKETESITALVMERASCTLFEALHGGGNLIMKQQRRSLYSITNTSAVSNNHYRNNNSSNISNSINTNSFYSNRSSNSSSGGGILSTLEKIQILRDVTAALVSLLDVNSDFVHGAIQSSNVLLYHKSSTDEDTAVATPPQQQQQQRSLLSTVLSDESMLTDSSGESPKAATATATTAVTTTVNPTQSTFSSNSNSFIINNRNSNRSINGNSSSGGILVIKLNGLMSSVSSKSLLQKKLQADSVDCTADYLAPEIFAGAPFTAASDVYAMGTLINETLTPQTRRPLLSSLSYSTDRGDKDRDHGITPPSSFPSSSFLHAECVLSGIDHKRPVLFYDCLADYRSDYCEYGFACCQLLRDLVLSAWQPLPQNRCSMRRMQALLNNIYLQMLESTTTISAATAEVAATGAAIALAAAETSLEISASNCSSHIRSSNSSSSSGTKVSSSKVLQIERMLASSDAAAFAALKQWLLAATDNKLSDFHASNCAVDLLRENIGTVQKLARRLQKDPNLFVRLGWNQYAVADIQQQLLLPS